jgi:hypothetical protein
MHGQLGIPDFSSAAFWYLSEHRVETNQSTHNSMMEYRPLDKQTPTVVGDVVVVYGLQGRAELNGVFFIFCMFDITF